MQAIKKYWIGVSLAFVVCMFTKPILCFLLLGGFAVFVGVMGIKTAKSIKKNGVNGTGIIVDLEYDSNGYATPVIEFTSTTGAVYRIKPYVYSSNSFNLQYGENSMNKLVAILYYADDPNKMILKETSGVTQFSLTVIILVWSVFVLFSIASLLGFIDMG